MKEKVEAWIDSEFKKIDPPVSDDLRDLIKGACMELVEATLELKEKGLMDEQEIRDLIQAKSEEAKEFCDEEIITCVQDICEDILINGKSMLEAFGFSKEHIPWFYMEGYKYFKAGQYEKALNYFNFLLLFYPQTVRFIFAASSCYHHLKDYQKAVCGYLLCATKDKNSPLPFYHMADCYQELGDYDKAYAMMKLAVSRAEKHPGFENLCNRAQMMMEKMKDEHKITSGTS